MKPPRLWSILAFTVYLLVGLLLGSALRTTLAQALPPSKTPLAQDEQRSILLVFVDDLNSAHPRLQGAWLMVYVSSKYPLTLFPVYPNISNDPASRDGTANHRLEQSFELTRSRRLSQDFVSVLKTERRLRLDGYVILDEYSLGWAIDSWAQTTPSRSGQATLAALPRPWERPAEALNRQQAILNHLCKSASYSRLDLAALYQATQQHVATDMEPGQVIAEWQSIFDHSLNRTCEFPTFQQQIVNSQ